MNNKKHLEAQATAFLNEANIELARHSNLERAVKNVQYEVDFAAIKLTDALGRATSERIDQLEKEHGKLLQKIELLQRKQEEVLEKASFANEKAKQFLAML